MQRCGKESKNKASRDHGLGRHANYNPLLDIAGVVAVLLFTIPCVYRVDVLINLTCYVLSGIRAACRRINDFESAAA